MTDRDTYTVDVAGVTRELPLFEVAPGVRIAILNILGDTELVRAAAGALSDRIDALDADVLVTDVISTGSTLEAMRKVVEEAGGTTVAETAVFTEGDKAKWGDIIAVGHLPVFTS